MNEKQYDLINNSMGWILFGMGMVVYLLTLEPTTPLWDVGEFISASYKLQVVHPPGAPFFLMLNRLFSLFAPSDEMVAALVNSQAATSSALTAMMLFWTITALSRKILVGNDNSVNKSQTLAILGSGLVGATTFIFTDTFWFSAVEGEVYALSILFMSTVLWLALKWERRADQPGNTKYLLLIAYLVGLSIGVHLLSLLVIPVVAFVYYFRKWDQITTRGIVITGLVGLVGLGIVNQGVIKTIPWIASQFELLFVNSFGLPFWSGIFFTIILIAGILIWGIYYSYVNSRSILLFLSVFLRTQWW